MHSERDTLVLHEHTGDGAGKPLHGRDERRRHRPADHFDLAFRLEPEFGPVHAGTGKL